MKDPLFTIRASGKIYFNKLMADRIGFNYGDNLEFKITDKSVYFRICNECPDACRVYAAGTSGFTICDKNIYNRVSKVNIFDVRIVRVRNWFKIMKI